MMMNDKVSGLVYGLALGDAWGNPTEFVKYPELMTNPHLYAPIPDELVITDDTQMSLYGFDALKNILSTVSYTELSRSHKDEKVQNKCRKLFADEFVKFVDDPRNTRAPGVACMNSLRFYKDNGGSCGDEGTVLTQNSKGCGTIMRSPWLGMAPLGDREIAVLSILQSQVTHGHPMASIASAWMSLTIKHLLVNNDPTKVPSIILSTDPCDILNKLPDNLVDKEQLSEFKHGVMEACLVNGPLWLDNSDDDPCQYLGEGWVAEEAFYCPAFVAATLGSDNIGHALTRLVMTGGDSDSLAAMGGALLGAGYGLEAFNIGYTFINDFEGYYRPLLADVEIQGVQWMFNM